MCEQLFSRARAKRVVDLSSVSRSLCRMNRLEDNEDSVACVEEEEKEDVEIDRSRASGDDRFPPVAVMGVDVKDIVVGVDDDEG